MLSKIIEKDGYIYYLDNGEELFKFKEEDIELLALNNVNNLKKYEKKKILEKIDLMLEEVGEKEQFVFDNILCNVIQLETLEKVKNSLEKEKRIKRVEYKLLFLENIIKNYLINKEELIENMGKLFFSNTGRLCLIMCYYELLLKNKELNRSDN